MQLEHVIWAPIAGRQHGAPCRLHMFITVILSPLLMRYDLLIIGSLFAIAESPSSRALIYDKCDQCCHNNAEDVA